MSVSVVETEWASYRQVLCLDEECLHCLFIAQGIFILPQDIKVRAIGRRQSLFFHNKHKGKNEKRKRKRTEKIREEKKICEGGRSSYQYLEFARC